MQHVKTLIQLGIVLFISWLTVSNSYAQTDYGYYHVRIIDAEMKVSEEKFEEALAILDTVFQDYNFVFLKDYKVAAQLAVITDQESKSKEYLQEALRCGWTKKEIKKNKLLKPIFKEFSKGQLAEFQKVYQSKLNENLRNEVHHLYKKDQKMAIKNLFRLGQKAKVRYTESQFAPHSEAQIAHLSSLIKNNGYPGEQLIGNNFWASTILSHHNSISANYNKKDSLYTRLKPLLLFSIKNGTMSPEEYALIDNWKIASQSDHGVSSYGFLGPELTEKTVDRANYLRDQIGMRSIGLRNALVKLESKWKIKFYLTGNPWQNGAIKVNE